jgi:uncharacterized Zn-finger protein
MKKPF